MHVKAKMFWRASCVLRFENIQFGERLVRLKNLDG
jgi:hypothetical protein